MSQSRAKRMSESRIAEAGEEQTQTTRCAQLRAQVQTANELAAVVLSQAAETRATQSKAERREKRQTRVTQQASVELAIYAETVQRQHAKQERVAATALDGQKKIAKQSAADEQRQANADLHRAILQKKEQKHRAAALKSEQEAELARKQTEKKQSAGREGVAPQGAVTTARPVPATGGQPEGTNAIQQRQQEELRAASAKQVRREKQQKKDSEQQAAELAATASQIEQERQIAEEAQPENLTPVQRQAAAEKVVAQKTSAEDEHRRQRAALSVAPRAISGSGSSARAAIATPATSTGASTETAASVTPFVTAQGSFVFDENGDAVVLQGVTVVGLDTVAPQTGQTFPASLSLGANNLAVITNQWGANLVRLPFAASTILTGNEMLAANDLLAGLDLTVAAITDAGACVLLALQAASGATPADAGTLQVWKTLAARYQGEPRVFYEVFCASSAIAGDFNGQFVTLIGAIQEQNPTALIFLPGNASGLDVTSVPLRGASGDPLQNLVYTIAIPGQNVVNPDLLSTVSAKYPVFASVWSDDGSDLGRQASRVADLFGRYGMGWAAGNWNTAPALVTNAVGADFTPTIWGNVVLRALKLTAPPLLEAADAPASLATLSTDAPKVSRLRTSGNFILDDSGTAIALRGVTVGGLDTAAPTAGQTAADAIGIDANNLALITDTWGMNLVRLPFLAETVLAGNGTITAAQILAGLDVAVTLISAAGAYVLLALEADPAATAPDASTQQAWQMLAKRYKDQQAVLYEIFGSAENLGARWLQSALSLIGTIRQQNSAAMIFVNTGNNGTDFTGLPLQLPTGVPIYNVVYTVNVSPQNPPGPDDGPLAAFADANPVFASTWSDDAGNPSRVSPYVGDFFGRHSIGFAAANWNADPRLVVDAMNQNFAPTAWGLIAGRAARLPVQQRLKLF